MTDYTEFKRLNFFPGFFTTADDWNAGQSYHLDKRKLHNRLLHTAGVANGLRVQPDPASHQDGKLYLQVQKGVALDGEGNLITLPHDTSVSIDPSASKTEADNQPSCTVHYVTIEYAEVLDDYHFNVQDPDYSGYTRVLEQAKVQASTQTPSASQVELARVCVKPDATVITEPADPDDPKDNEIDRRHVHPAGAIGIAPPRLSPEVQDAISLLMETKRQGFALLALRFPGPAVDDARHAALQVRMSVDSLEPGQLPGRIGVTAALEHEVEQELGRRYPPLVKKVEYVAYQDAVAALLEALRTNRPSETLLNCEGAVTEAARKLAGVVFPPPTAHAGQDQSIVAEGAEAIVHLDASGSQAAEGQQIVNYRWEKEQ